MIIKDCNHVLADQKSKYEPENEHNVGPFTTNISSAQEYPLKPTLLWWCLSYIFKYKTIYIRVCWRCMLYQQLVREKEIYV